MNCSFSTSFSDSKITQTRTAIHSLVNPIPAPAMSLRVGKQIASALDAERSRLPVLIKRESPIHYSRIDYSSHARAGLVIAGVRDPLVSDNPCLHEGRSAFGTNPNVVRCLIMGA